MVRRVRTPDVFRNHMREEMYLPVWMLGIHQTGDGVKKKRRRGKKRGRPKKKIVPPKLVDAPEPEPLDEGDVLL